MRKLTTIRLENAAAADAMVERMTRHGKISEVTVRAQGNAVNVELDNPLAAGIVNGVNSLSSALGNLIGRLRSDDTLASDAKA